MKNFKETVLLRAIKAFAVVLAVIPFAFCWYYYFADILYTPFYNRGNWFIIALFVLIYVVLARVYDAFWISVNRVSEIVYSQSLTALITDFIMYIITWLLIRSLPNILPMLAILAVQILFSVIWSVLAQKWYYHVFPPQKTAVIFDKDYRIEQLIEMYGLDKKFDIRFRLNISDCTHDLSILEDVNTVFISGVQSHERNIILKYCIARGINVYVLPRIGDIIMSGASHIHMFHLPMLRVGRHSPYPEEAFLKRAFDIILSSLMLLLASPVMLITAIAIKISDGGTVFYRQKRLTQNGKVFHILKFRSMRMDAEKDGIARLSTGDADNRITPIGKIIRKVRIDELPQLLNILQGSMSIVGPRPERPEIAEQYERELPEFRLRLQVKAGLTGYAQVYGKYNSTPYDKLQMDLMYIAHPNLFEDLRIIFATVKILFVPESTDGISEGQTTAADTPVDAQEFAVSGSK